MKKQKLRIIIEKSSDYYDAYAENCAGINGAGATVEEAKKDVLEGLKIFLEITDKVPSILAGDYEIEYVYDVQSFLKYYEKILSKSGLEKITGINQKQLGHYANGNKTPRPEIIKKMEVSLQSFAKELSQVHFCH
jgi:predicted RNase H-like HicB family nuclease